MSDFDAQVTVIETLLTAEETSQPVLHFEEFMFHRTQRATLTQAYQSLSAQLGELRRRMNALPRLAPVDIVQWAHAVQAFPNLVFLEIDTDGLYSDADILRLVLLDHQGEILYDQLVKPKHPISAQLSSITGITSQMLEYAPSLSEIWTEFSVVIAGKYVLSFNLAFDAGKLIECATRYHLAPLTVIGDCLMIQAGKYYDSESRYLKLASLCSRIGHSLPEQPLQTAHDRAQGQRHVLEAMAQGITDVQAPNDDLGEIDEHPF